MHIAVDSSLSQNYDFDVVDDYYYHHLGIQYKPILNAEKSLVLKEEVQK